MRDKEIRQEVGQRLQEIRGRRDQRTFAEAVDSVQQTISKYERGEIPRSWIFLARLAEAEGIDLNRLLTGHSVSRSGNGDRNGWGPRVSEEQHEPAGASV
ncbi:MAG TPA: helix-turn-helix transcriptional regulator [Gemmatimonadota bacterium]|nr:helix-turn-helix transcriptional regulator [Gemmatimonadota bacterium]